MSESKFSHTEYAIQLQEKFELYILGLIFTLLGLSIQTAKFDVSNIADTFEILSWLFLLISGLVGLSRFEWLPVAHKQMGALSMLESEKKALTDLRDQGHEHIRISGTTELEGLESTLLGKEQYLGKVNEKVDELSNKIILKYNIHKWTFVSAIICLFVARSYPHLAKLVCAPLNLFIK